MIFYYPDGSQSDNVDHFITFYSKVYYFLVGNLKFEKEIEHILTKTDNLDKDDIVKILCWKTGGIKLNDNEVKYRYGIINVDEIYKKIREKNKSNFKSISPNDLLQELTSIQSIGPVCAITIMYFLSNGEYPIYDKFAHIAINALTDKNFKFNSVVTEEALHKEVRCFTKYFFDDYKTKYIGKIQDVFGYRRKERNVDQALWAYGHMFNDNKKNSPNGK